MSTILKEVLQPNQIVRLKTLDRFASYFGNEPRRLDGPIITYLFITIKSGYGHCLIDNEYTPLIAGTALIVSPYSYLHLENIKYLLGSVIVFTEAFFCKNQFSENMLYKVVYDIECRPVLQLGDDKVKIGYINSNVQMFGSEYRMLKDKSADNELLFNLLYGIILMLHKVQLVKKGRNYDNNVPHLKNRVVEFIKLINLHYKEQHRLEFYADKMGISVAMLGKICKTACGWSAKVLIQSKLITEAKLLLMFDPCPISDISFELGFQEHNAFSRFFREEVKMTAFEYRELNNLKVI